MRRFVETVPEAAGAFFDAPDDGFHFPEFEREAFGNFLVVGSPERPFDW